MRNCRVCLTPDITNSFTSIFENNGRIVFELHEAFEMTIVELAEAPALICRRCEKYVSQAAALKRVLIKSNSFFRQTLRNETYIWHENLRELKNARSLEEESQSNHISETRLEEFMKEADDLLSKSLSELSAEHLITEVKQEKEDDRESMYAETELCSDNEDCFESENTTKPDQLYMNLDLLSMSQIGMMTERISKVLSKIAVEEKVAITKLRKQLSTSLVCSNLAPKRRRQLRRRGDFQINLRSSGLVSVGTHLPPIYKPKESENSTKASTSFNLRRSFTRPRRFST